MGDARTIQVRPTPGEIAPGDAAASLLRHGWRRVRDHLRHSLPWIVLCGFLTYDLWVAKSRASQVAAQPVGDNSAAAAPAEKSSASPVGLVGNWSFKSLIHGSLETKLEFKADGTVISRTQGKVERGTYEARDSRLELRFARRPFFWESYPLPGRFAISGNELTLFAMDDGVDFASAKVYRFKRLGDSAAPDLAASAPPQ